MQLSPPGAAGKLPAMTSTPAESAAARPLEVAIVETQRQLREGLSALIGCTPGFRTSALCGSMEDALRDLTAKAPDLLLADIGLPGVSGIEGVRRFWANHPAMPVLMLMSSADRVDHLADPTWCPPGCPYHSETRPSSRNPRKRKGQQINKTVDLPPFFCASKADALSG